MARISWDVVGTRVYEGGIDRAVLYVPGQDGVAWPGMISVSEEPSGGDPLPYYLDGLKYLNLSSAEEFEATITSFTPPLEFGVCDGTVQIQNGLFVAQQPRRSFGFCYRTFLGNDVNGAESAYKIHLVYGALAAPPTRDYKTFAQDADPLQYSWKITTLPPSATGFKPTAHFVVDSRYADAITLSGLEDILYGTAVTAPRIPSVYELGLIFSAMGFPPIKAEYFVSHDYYEIHEVDPEDADVSTSPVHPPVPSLGSFTLWLDSSSESYFVPILVIGE